MNLIIKSSSNQRMRQRYVTPCVSIYNYCYQDSSIRIVYISLSCYQSAMENIRRGKHMNDKSNDLKGNTIKDADVYDLLLRIPPGKVTTYGDLAKALGNPLASREIGRILGNNPNPIEVPCHRVVMSDGKVGGYIYGSNRKRELLEKEGISFSNGIVSNLTKVRVYP